MVSRIQTYRVIGLFYALMAHGQFYILKVNSENASRWNYQFALLLFVAELALALPSLYLGFGSHRAAKQLLGEKVL